MKFAGHATGEMPGDAHTSWLEAATLGWLKGYDKVMLTEPPEVGATFTLVEDHWRTTCRFTRVEPPIALCWEGEDGSSGTLEFEPRGATTRVNYHAVYVPKAAVDKVAAGLIGAFARSKAQRETDKDAAGELRHLARRVKLRIDGKPVDDRVPALHAGHVRASALTRPIHAQSRCSTHKADCAWNPGKQRCGLAPPP